MGKSEKENKSIVKTPSGEGYFFPAEWEKHDAVFLSWPHDTTSFPDMLGTEKAYVAIITALQETKSEKVRLFVTGEKMQERAEKAILENGGKVSGVEFFTHAYQDVWFRDYGPTFVVNRQKKRLGIVKWKFNGYGSRYPELLIDDKIPDAINAAMKLPVFRTGIFFEGGAFEMNGNGMLLTTTLGMLNTNRNPGMDMERAEKIFRQFLGAEKTIWLEHGIGGDDTDGHIDNLARFVNGKTILCALEENEKDSNHHGLAKNHEKLLGAVDNSGKKFGIVGLPMPHVWDGKKRLPASYANFYIANKAVLVPQFNDGNDAEALSIIKKSFPGRKAVGIDCSKIVYGNGTLHCITQQQPKP